MTDWSPTKDEGETASLDDELLSENAISAFSEDVDEEEEEDEGVVLTEVDYAEDTFTLARLHHPLLSEEEKRALLWTMQHGSSSEAIAARDRLITCNQRLVYSVARRWIGGGVPLADLMQEGNFGLWRGLEKFDLTKGYKFSTYVRWWIRQAVGRGFSQQYRTIRLPVHKHDEVTRYLRTVGQLTRELSREPMEDEVATALGVSVELVREWQQIARRPAYLSHVAPDGEDELGDFLAGEDDVEAEGMQQLVMESLHQALAELKPREREVIAYRFGFFDASEPCLRSGYSLEETGRIFGLTRERIRQIEARALRKLRQNRHLRRLEGA